MWNEIQDIFTTGQRQEEKKEEKTADKRQVFSDKRKKSNTDIGYSPWWELLQDLYLTLRSKYYRHQDNEKKMNEVHLR